MKNYWIELHKVWPSYLDIQHKIFVDFYDDLATLNVIYIIENDI